MNPRSRSFSGAELLKAAAVGELLEAGIDEWTRSFSGAELLKDAAVGELLEAGIDKS